MKFNNLLILNTVLALVFGVGLVLMPATVAAMYGIAPEPAVNLMGQFFGTELLAVGLLAWFARNISDSKTQGAITLAFVIANVVGLVVSVMGTLSGVMNAVGWSAVVIYLVLSLGYAYFQFAKPGAS